MNTMLMFAKRDENQGTVKQSGSGKSNKDDSFCCDICGESVGLISAERAATLCQCSRRKIYRWIDEGDLHYKELPDGAVLVCGRSLAKKIEELSITTNQLSGH